MTRSRSDRRWSTFAKNHPERAALIEATRLAIQTGGLVPEVCPAHGPMAPAYDWTVVARVGWRCNPCRLPEPAPQAMEAQQPPEAHDPSTVEEDVDVNAWI